MGSSSSKEERREKKGRKEQEGDKIKITSQRWGLPSRALKWPLPQARLPLCCGSMWHPVLLSGPHRAQLGPDLTLPSTHTHTHAYYE